ncbi:NADH:flavin oxidoreductase/NADH oxidase family protein [Curvibacter sp. APW13]|uniref:NADH:flavin oxidoreductase/NADH oxidase family protein n=1 Tax=Curvibacter sp. APW13 TaxID=3077236 RepID=UPI0028DD8A87|nr:NADH:flavin oxidoreductase/NADH oxidase family protein [Curvibacter sp. APW13]MDT8990782.1 NADH:flavin oxidoreductase/NADH oxidase family protein [Curvibacter sp. APW13]
MTSALFSPLTLPNGSTLPNRIAKAAMEEQLAGPGQLPSDDIIRLYQTLAEGGTGLLITGNVMVDARALTSAGGIVLQKDTPPEPFRRWATAARSRGGQVWMQINHPGRQVWAALGQPGWAPSDVAVDLGKHSKLFAPVRAMSEAEIAQTIQHFVDTALRAENAGFTGVEIHAAHGYLISQFLSPLTNRRTDAWGGSLDNRARLLLAVVDAVRAAVQPGFCVAVKLNSADFQRGGFDADAAKQVVAMLAQRQVDLVELSGGSYEAPAMQGRTRDGRTLAREAYFLEFAQAIAQGTTLPIMTTGGIRRLAVAERVLAQGVDVVGMGTALAQCPDLPQHWRTGRDVENLEPQVRIKNKAIASLATMALVRRQLQRVGAGKHPLRHPSAVFSLVRDQWRARHLTKRYRAWMAKTPR